MTPLIEFFIKQLFCPLFETFFLVLGFHLWDKVKYPFSFRKWMAVLIIFTSVGNMIGVQIGMIEGIANYIALPGLAPPPR